MRSQQQAERAEQQRIKSLVLNYDLHDDQHDGTEEPAFHYIQSPTSKRSRLVGKGTLNKSLPTRRRVTDGSDGQSQHSTSPTGNTTAAEKRDSLSPLNSDTEAPASNVLRQDHDSFANEVGHIDHPHTMPRLDKSGNSRSKQRARKLQMGDIDWQVDHRSRSTPTEGPPSSQLSLDSFVKQKKQQRGDSQHAGSDSRNG